KFSKQEKKFQHELNFSMYNVYGRKNAWMVSFVQDENQPDVMYAEKMYLFRFIPSLTWNFKF
ncbi:MAG: hypothetical protein LBH19_06555, partial [Dysgonamonadaceae bacterium]|nr:hypothetical protein [Dysgonamonadaceae bacterium]